MYWLIDFIFSATAIVRDNAAASEIPFINHIYDSGQTVIPGTDKEF